MYVNGFYTGGDDQISQEFLIENTTRCFSFPMTTQLMWDHVACMKESVHRYLSPECENLFWRFTETCPASRESISWKIRQNTVTPLLKEIPSDIACWVNLPCKSIRGFLSFPLLFLSYMYVNTNMMIGLYQFDPPYILLLFSILPWASMCIGTLGLNHRACL